MDDRVASEAHDASRRRCPGHSHLPTPLDNREGQVAAVPGIGVADVDRDPLRLALDSHGRRAPRRWVLIAQARHVADRLGRTVSPVFLRPWIAKDPNRGDRDETFAHRGFQLQPQELLHAFGSIDDLDHDRKLEGGILARNVVHLMVGSVAHFDEEDGRSRQMSSPRRLDDHLVEGLAMPIFIGIQVNTEQACLLRDHGSLPFLASGNGFTP